MVRALMYSDTTALDRAKLPERERISLAEQRGACRWKRFLISMENTWRS